jgi:hypothetical protein
MRMTPDRSAKPLRSFEKTLPVPAKAASLAPSATKPAATIGLTQNHVGGKNYSANKRGAPGGIIPLQGAAPSRNPGAIIPLQTGGFV